MVDDGKPMDWAAREAVKDLRAAHESERLTAKSARDWRLKEEGRPGLLEELRAWIEGQAKSYGRASPAQAFEVGKVQQFGGPDSYDYFHVSDTSGRRLPMKIISHHSAPHGVLVECGVVPKPEYLMSVEDSGTLFFQTPKGQSKTIEEIGSESLDSWKRARI